MFTEKLKERYEVNVKAVQDAIYNLRSMVIPDSEAGIGHDSTRQALTAIFAYYNIIRPVTGSKIEDLDDAQRMLERNDLLCIRMKLSGKWWKETGGPVLALDSDGNLTAILPAIMGYVYVEPETGRKRRLKSGYAAGLASSAINIFPGFPKKSLSKKEFRKYCMGILPKKAVAMILLLCTLATLLNMCIPIANKNIFSDVIPSGASAGILPICGFLLGSSLSAVLFKMCSNFALFRAKDKFNTVLQTSLMSRLLYLPSAFFKKYSAGDMGMRVLAANNIYQLLTSQILAGMATAVFSLMYVIIAFVYAKSMIFVVSFTAIAAICEAVFLFRFYLRKYSQAIPASVKAQDFAYNAILGIQKIKNCRAEQRAFSQWAQRFSRSEVVDNRNKFITVSLTCISTFLAYFVAWKSHIAVSNFVAFMSAFGIMLNAIGYIMPFFANIANIVPYIDMLEPILAAEPEDKNDCPMVEDISGAIDINHVSFRYTSDSPYILDDVSLHIPAGQNVALVGKSGCGKSTLMRLLLGFEEPQSGSIFYGHYNISKVNLGSLRQFVGFCPQSMQIIPGTIAENIRFATISCTEEDIWNAARIACLDEDIKKMPLQMQTMLGEGGTGLSGGQCQRLLIARAVLNNPRILFLDEATSALDNITQKQVINNLSEFGCTRIAIAHRLSTVMNCDRIIAMDKGKIIEDGTPAELIAKKGFFYELSERQM